MLRIDPERRVAVALVILIIGILMYGAWRLSRPPVAVPGLDEAHRLHQYIQQGINAGFRRAEELSGQGRYEDAGFILLDLAGATHVFKQITAESEYSEARATEPTALELTALFEFTQAGSEERAALESLLVIKYPTWRAAN